MKNQRQNKVLAWVTTICLLVGTAAGAMAQNASTSDFEALGPLMDLVTGAVMTATDDPETIPGAEGTLSNAFVNAFFRLGQTADASLNLTADMLTNTQQQAVVLGKVFAAQLPELQPIAQAEGINGYIGFLPVTVNTAAETGGIQIMGEVYWAKQPIKTLTEAEYEEVQWVERGIFSFQNDQAALNGFRLTGFSVGTELNMEMALQNYSEEILVEYVNTGLGFSIQYPSMFTDDLLVEDEDGVSAALKDGSASFFAKRVDNVSKADLQDYVNVIANGITSAKAQVNEEFQYATVTYTTEEGFTVFDVYIVTDKYIYQAELSYRTDLISQYHMYNSYLEYNFNVDELAVG